MANQEKEGSAGWAAQEKQAAQRGYQTGTNVNQEEFNKVQAQKQHENPKDSKGCFPKGALVSTPQGKRAIELLMPGDDVLSWCIESSNWRTAKILRKVEHVKPERVCKIKFVDGRSVRATRLHSLMTDSGWRTVGDIGAGQKLYCEDSDSNLRLNVIESIETGEAEPVFNLVTERYHNFVVDGVVAHNFTWFRLVRVIWWRLATAASVKSTSTPGQLSGY